MSFGELSRLPWYESAMIVIAPSCSYRTNPRPGLFPFHFLIGAGPLLGPLALAERPFRRRRRGRIRPTIDGNRYATHARVGRYGRYERIAGWREPESRPEIGGRELLNFDELGHGHRQGHGKHEES